KENQHSKRYLLSNHFLPWYTRREAVGDELLRKESGYNNRKHGCWTIRWGGRPFFGMFSD
ncbi:MAG: hypothetical protein ACXADB_06800, partial [Candidatus Hermodarchaeia archaeon]